VRNAALTALERSPEPPPLAILERAFRSAKGEAALRLIRLLFEQEYVDFPATLLADFNKRTEAERLTIMTLIAGHTDLATMDLTVMGLRDPSLEVQRAALMRLLAFPREKAIALLSSYTKKPPLRQLEQAVRSEIESRRLWPFLSSDAGLQAMASETVFPSFNGTVPMVSPDGQWVAYVETGWGRPGGSGGMGRSNLLSLVHAVRRDGSGDRLVSDLFLAGWMPDSKRIASARDGYAAICDLEGNVVTEFGSPLDKQYLSQRGDWKSDPRHQWGNRMPKSRRLPKAEDFDFGEDGAFSPDGKWFGPMLGNGVAHFIDSSGRMIKVKLPGDFIGRPYRASWSPDGRHVVLMNLGDESGAVVIDARTWAAKAIQGVDPIYRNSDWEYRKCRWNPWSKDGSRLAFLRNGQVWIATPDGGNAKQLTFDSARKAYPVFSRDSNRIAYVSCQADNRRHYERMGSTDLWVVDIETTLCVRVTAPSSRRIYCLDWIDDQTLIFDRVDENALTGSGSSLIQLSLQQSGWPKNR
jgi:hypothetical protein